MYNKKAAELIRKIQIMLCALGMSATLGARADWKADLKSPVTTDAKWILISGTGLTLLSVAFHDSVFEPFEDRTVEKKPLGSATKYGDALGQLIPNALYAGGAWASEYFGDKLGNERAWMMIEATAYAAFITTALKYTIREPRPNSAARNSFPSGHATTAFAFAGVVAAEHGWTYGVPAMLLATFVGYTRIEDNQHRVHDVVAGATIGLTCAYGIYYAHQDEKSGRSARLHFFPKPIPGGAELAGLWLF